MTIGIIAWICFNFCLLQMWKQDGLDLRLKPYGCLALGNEFGLIEVVPHAHTTSNINIVSLRHIITLWQVSRSGV
jgi:phosphatidylinositol kinase/protein kinase (PI-3  family)